ncbi:MAG: nucleotide sugar dehydrogenase [Acidobacteriaceae bacterium]|nr:nucleotide sugar dehydrogenase [Acidobacteriaceae bacterium]
MKISVFGLGYVGTVCAACLAERGHTVVGVDKSEVKVELVRSGRSPIIERDIDDLVSKMVGSGRLSATPRGAEAVAATDLSIICVGTPSRDNGSLALEAIETVSSEIGQAIRAKAERHTVVIRSTVAPGTTRNFIAPRISEASGSAEFGLAFNPEFLREGSAVSDFNTPAKTIVGALQRHTAHQVMALYDGLPGPKITTALETAELAKYVDNAWHALKVAFGNEVGVLAKTMGIDSHEVMDIFIQDNRLNISPAYLKPGFAFGGSCLPKDLRALTYVGRKLDLSLPVLNHILDSNRMLIERGVNWILGKPGRRVAFLGISFKAGTDDVRESPFVELVERLIGKGCKVRIFDPNVNLSRMIGANKDYLLRVLPHITELMVPDITDALSWAETIVVSTPDPIYVKHLATARSDQVVLDFAQLRSKNGGTIKSEGFLW